MQAFIPTPKPQKTTQHEENAYFFGKSGHVTAISLGDRRHFLHHENASADTAISLRDRRHFLHHENASADTAATTVGLLDESELQLVAAPTVFARRLSLRLLPISGNEETTEAYPA